MNKIFLAAGLWLIFAALAYRNRAGIAGGGEILYEQAKEIMGNLTRGERNNNPGNIERTGINWLGMSPEQPDERFLSFVEPKYGIRALAKLLINYAGKGVDTVSEIISRYAPGSENDTASYIAAVSRSIGVDPNVRLDFRANPELLFALVKAIIKHENGRVIYSDEKIREGIDMVA